MKRLLLLLAVLVTMVGFAPSASAHDVLISTSPKDGATVAQNPANVVLTFNNPALATGSVIQVTGPSGRVDEGKPTFVDHTVTQPLKPGPAGAYTVKWRVTSVDGHPISGSFRFTTWAVPVPPASTTAPSPSSAAPTAAPTAGTSSATATTTSSAAAPAPKDDGESGPNLLIVLVGVLVAGGVVGALVGLARRRSGQSYTHDEDD
ncbi:copper resistance CopC family protein [Luteipulveratus mongoliensis]|uniref:CopC domain-containing protein n=1 Tax=Luteipulveratus mongoliensis TaxID=571913 RepID=A0A0K1JNW6_9MICO|nr:copper resistance CopC family protein [Luteipulveratus mongoliensis]AKU18414.1 hypothetical protein VV02_25460 [Luteipulveratus mongoliensis]